MLMGQKCFVTLIFTGDQMDFGRGFGLQLANMLLIDESVSSVYFGL